MLTAIEIRNQKFKKSLNGYNCAEVDGFILNLAQEYETLYAERHQQSSKIQDLNEHLARYQKMEATLNESIVVAKQAADLLKANAHREAELILAESKRKIVELLSIYQEIIKRLNIVNVEIKSQLQTELVLLDKNEQRVTELSNFFYGKDIKDLLEKLSFLAIDDTTDVGDDSDG